jgi:hypothetical protein
MAGFTTIRSAILAKLNGVSSLAFSYAYMRDVVEGYPSAMFDVTDTDNTFLTNAENSRTYSWTIYVMQETKSKTVVQAGAILDSVCDSIVDAFENDITLGNLVDWCAPFTGGRDEVDTPQGTMLVQTLIISATTHVLVA